MLTSLFCISVLISIRETILGFFYLPWVGRQIIPSIYELNAILTNDFYTNSAKFSPYISTAFILKPFFSSEINEIIFEFSIYQTFFDLLNVASSSLMVTLISLFLYSKLTNKNYRVSSVIGIITMGFISAFLVFGREGFLNFIWPRSAGWSMPLFNFLNPQGISWFIVSVFLILYFVEIRKIKEPRALSSKISLMICVLLTICATIIHPITPLIQFMVLFGTLIFSGNLFKTECFKITILMLSWFSTVLLLILIFDSGHHSATNFYETYVEIRHPHHYKPSYYFSTVFSLLPLLATSVFFILLMAYQKSCWRLYCIYLLGLAFAPHVFQFIFVEVYRLEAFIKLGPSRLVMAFTIIGTACLGMMVIHLTLIFVKKTRRRLIVKQLILAIYKISSTKFSPIALSFGILGSCCYIYFGTFFAFDNTLNSKFEFKLKSELSKNGFLNAEILNLADREILPREFMGMSVYYDSYFPFTKRAVDEWRLRHDLVQNFKDCLKENLSNFNSCERQLLLFSKTVIISRVPINYSSVNFRSSSDIKSVYLTYLDKD